MANITLVDDDENIVASVSLALESHGHTVKAYYDGASGLAALESDPPDLAILDVKMPRMDGVEATRAIRSLGGAVGGTPIIALTANADPDDAAIYLAAGMNAVVEKPIKPERLLAAMTELLPTDAAADTVAAA